MNPPKGTAGSISGYGVDARLRALAVLRARAARQADAADHLAADHDRQAAVDGHGALDPEHAQTLAALRQHVLERLGRPLEPRRRAGLLLADDRAADGRVVHLLEVDEIAVGVHHRHRHRPAVLAHFGQRRGGNLLRVLETDWGSVRHLTLP